MQEILLTEEAMAVKKALAHFGSINIAIIFGSVAKNEATAQSDFDIAINNLTPLGVEDKIEIISALAQATGRPIDLVDLRDVGEPLLGQILQHGKWLIGTDAQKGTLLSRHLIDAADFSPYRARILAERQREWTQ